MHIHCTQLLQLTTLAVLHGAEHISLNIRSKYNFVVVELKQMELQTFFLLAFKKKIFYFFLSFCHGLDVSRPWPSRHPLVM